MKYLKIYWFILCLSPLILNAQGQNNIWYFGHNCGLDFNSGTPISLLDGQMDQTEGVAAISDTLGNLLFYTNGRSIWNKNHQHMVNGGGLSGTFTTTQSATIVPNPFNCNEYYIFTAGAHGNGSFRYSVVDMTLDSGNGAVVNKNIFLHAPTSEKCAIVYGNNNIWIIGHDTDSLFYSYLFTSTGISPPVISNFSHIDGMIFGYLQSSPNGSKLAAALGDWNVPGNVPGGEFALFDFDFNTGIVSNRQIINPSINYAFGTYGIEFSPDGTKLYTSPYGGISSNIYQYDITGPTTASILNSQDSVGWINTCCVGAFQTGPDNKIYITAIERSYLAIINSPNLQGSACAFDSSGVYLGGRLSTFGLPNSVITSICNTYSYISENPERDQYLINPNPVSENLKLTGHNIHAVTITNILGATLLYFDNLDGILPYHDLDIHVLTAGLYILRVNGSSILFIKT